MWENADCLGGYLISWWLVYISGSAGEEVSSGILDNAARGPGKAGSRNILPAPRLLYACLSTHTPHVSIYVVELAQDGYPSGFSA